MQMEGMEEQVLEPMSPSAQYLRSSVLSLSILGVLESEVPIDDSMTMSLLKDVFLPINPRLSSIMVTGKKGVKKWKKVEVNLEEHVNVPSFLEGMPVEYYDDCFAEYLTGIAMEALPPSRPLWEVHIVKYPTRNAAGNVVFKLHHSLGDGYSLMGALLSCLQRLDNPLLPLTFPSNQSSGAADGRRARVLFRLPRFFTGLVHTVYDFGWGLLKSSLVEDDISPIRSGDDGVEFRPIVTATTTFSIDQIKEIKSRLKVTMNDVIVGVITLGTRIYMQKMSPRSGEAKSTALVLFNTRAIRGYKSVDEMVKPGSDMLWGNRFAFLQVPIPKLPADEMQDSLDPLTFVKKSRKTIKRQRNSAVVFLTSQLLNVMRKLRGPETAAKYIHGTLKNTSMAMSNLVGPIEPMALVNHPVKGLYFIVAGPPQSLSVTMISYAGKLRIAMNVEKGFMDPNKFKSCIEYAFEAVSKAALESPSTAHQK